MSKEWLDTVVDVVEKSNVGNTVGPVVRGIQGVVHAGKIIDSQKEIKLRTLDLQYEFEVARMKHEEELSRIRSDNYKATLDHLSNNKETSESYKNAVWAGLYDTNHNLK